MNTYLYIIVFREKSAIKIGKADNVICRSKSLQKWWGKPDYDESYYLKISSKNVFTLERSLHLSFSNYALDFDDGDGKTEIFSLDALKYVIEHIKLYISHTHHTGVLVKGIDDFNINKYSNIKKRKDYVVSSYQKKEKGLCNSMNDATKKLIKISKVIYILLRYKNKLTYRYYLNDGLISFEIDYKSARKPLNRGEIFKMFSLTVSDFDDKHSFIGVNFLSSILTTDTGLKFEINTKTDSKDNFLIKYFALQIYNMITTLSNKIID